MDWTLVDPPTPTFSDVAPGSTFYRYIETAYQHSIISGYGNPDCSDKGLAVPCFFPGRNVTRGQMSKMVSNAVGFNDSVTGRDPSFYDVTSSNAFFMWIERLVMHATVSPIPQGVARSACNTTTMPCFYPYDDATRADVVQHIRSARDSNYFAQVFGWKWGAGNYQELEAYVTTPDPPTQGG